MTDVIISTECAELLRCTADQVEELARAGELPATKIGRAWLFVRADLLAYLAERARLEAEARRSRRQPGVSEIPQRLQSRRRSPPVLPKA
jgi:excisionase family DNA binding protein